MTNISWKSAYTKDLTKILVLFGNIQFFFKSFDCSISVNQGCRTFLHHCASFFPKNKVIGVPTTILIAKSWITKFAKKTSKTFWMKFKVEVMKFQKNCRFFISTHDSNHSWTSRKVSTFIFIQYYKIFVNVNIWKLL